MSIMGNRAFLMGGTHPLMSFEATTAPQVTADPASDSAPQVVQYIVIGVTGDKLDVDLVNVLSPEWNPVIEDLIKNGSKRPPNKESLKGHLTYLLHSWTEELKSLERTMDAYIASVAVAPEPKRHLPRQTKPFFHKPRFEGGS